MKFALRPAVLALLSLTTHFGAVAYAQSSQPPSASAIATKAPEDWIVYDNTTYTPVVDEVSRHLSAARKAFDAKDNKKAAVEMRAVAAELDKEATQAGEEGKYLTTSDLEQLTADRKHSDDVVKHLNAGAKKVRSVAESIENGKITTVAEMSNIINKATRTDMEQRWQVSDVVTWYPLVEEPQHRFTDAIAANIKKDYTATASDIRMAASYLRLESGRAIGDTKQELDKSVEQLDVLAASIEKGGVKDEHALASVFEKAEQSLALAHRAKAVDAVARKEYDKAGYEIKAAAQSLDSAAGWAGDEVKAGEVATVADARALGDKLAAGATLTREETAKGLENLGNSITALGHKIGGAK